MFDYCLRVVSNKTSLHFTSDGVVSCSVQWQLCTFSRVFFNQLEFFVCLHVVTTKLFNSDMRQQKRTRTRKAFVSKIECISCVRRRCLDRNWQAATKQRRRRNDAMQWEFPTESSRALHALRSVVTRNRLTWSIWTSHVAFLFPTAIAVTWLTCEPLSHTPESTEVNPRIRCSFWFWLFDEHGLQRQISTDQFSR